MLPKVLNLCGLAGRLTTDNGIHGSCKYGDGMLVQYVSISCTRAKAHVNVPYLDHHLKPSTSFEREARTSET